jgi:hypothetical protein
MDRVNQGLVLKPNRKWDGSQSHKFIISGRSDSDYNQGVVYLANNSSVGGRTRHIDDQSVFLKELKEAGILVIKWIAGTDNEAGIFTKNLDGPTFQRYTNIFTGGTDYD